MNLHHKTTHMSVIAAAATLLMLSLTSCGLTHPEDFPTDGPTHTATSNPQEVTADDFGHSWSLNVDHGTVSCEKNGKGDPVLRFTAPDGTEYALNAVDENAELPPIGDIADGSIGTLRTFAFTVCDA
jgi:predicted small lipoprotein YifL